MIRLAAFRHAPTEWNRAKRLQGRRDVPLDAAGRDWLAGQRLPPDLAGFDWFTSPLARARETAERLGVTARPDDRLIEMDWGRWEGRSLADLRAEDPDGIAAAEVRGLDLTPPGGESPRAVIARLRPLLAELAAAGRDCGFVTHKGVLRALLAEATGWPLLGRAPLRLERETILLFRLGPDRLDLEGSLHLTPREPPP